MYIKIIPIIIIKVNPLRFQNVGVIKRIFFWKNAILYNIFQPHPSIHIADYSFSITVYLIIVKQKEIAYFR